METCLRFLPLVELQEKVTKEKTVEVEEKEGSLGMSGGGLCQNVAPCLAEGGCDGQGPCTGHYRPWALNFDTCYRKSNDVVDCEAAGCIGGKG